MESITNMTERDPYLWKQAKARVGFRMHLRSYLIINAGFWLIWIVINLASTSAGHFVWNFPWPLFPMLGWGIGLASHYFAVFRGGNERNMIEAEYQKLLTRQ